ncbi:glycoside hydrolase family 76 protein [Xylariomycetidae sp. FL2044]|nr:glycoside hydrolase family 76 protein [Xylariomycetidae sp. FL2044]
MRLSLLALFAAVWVSRPSAALESEPDSEFLSDIVDAVEVLQSYFAPWLGTWPDAIDWTAAVMGTHVSGAMRSLSEAITGDGLQDNVLDWKLKSNLLDNYFTQMTAYYFGQDAFAIRNEAYDDILWVVLGWLETVQYINTHNNLHFQLNTQGDDGGVQDIGFSPANQTYHGNLWIPAFSHRARIFWDLASHGWDTKLCGGGMVWNPRLLPYKNAITNELYIAASISMYLYFPGDDNQSPFYNNTDTVNPEDPDIHIYSGPRDPKYLKAAIDGYRWLAGSNMTDYQGLYTDGFHISGYSDYRNNNTKCDQRTNVVYSYNQGVLLTGLRGLWDATGASSYLSDGHRLIRNVIMATGYDRATDSVIDDLSQQTQGILPPWRGLGRAGIMEDTCDASGTCSQDGQTFKGIFFHHLIAFCEPLHELNPDLRIMLDEPFSTTMQAHAEACASYGGWLRHNAIAAMGTRDENGRFGQWWTAGLLANWVGPWPTTEDDGIPHRSLTDYRNYGIPSDPIWSSAAAPSRQNLWKAMGSSSSSSSSSTGSHTEPIPGREQEDQHQDQKPMSGQKKHATMASMPQWRGRRLRQQWSRADDPNQRGRGRTVETQGGGLALLRAYWKIALDR